MIFNDFILKANVATEAVSEEVAPVEIELVYQKQKSQSKISMPNLMLTQCRANSIHPFNLKTKD